MEFWFKFFDAYRFTVWVVWPPIFRFEPPFCQSHLIVALLPVDEALGDLEATSS